MDTAEYDTNTLLINNIASIAFRIYEPPSDPFPSLASAALDIEDELRQGGHVVLFDSDRRGLWHFQLLGKEGHDEVNSNTLETTLNIRGIELAVVEEGILEPASFQKPPSQQQQAIQTPTSSISSASALDQSLRNTFTSATQTTGSSSQAQETKTVYENFITALLLSISSAFCSRTGAIPLNYRTILLPSDPLAINSLHDSQASQCPVLATLKAYLTTTGALVINFAVSRCRGLSSLANLVATNFAQSSAPILAAPFGVVANNQVSTSGEAGTASLAQTPNTQAFSVRVGSDARDSSWKQACLNILKLRGVASSSLADCIWVNLCVPNPRLQDAKSETKRAQAPGSTITIPWPGQLCFRKKTVEVSSTSRVGDTLFSGNEESHDPLGNAKVWFTSASDRDEKMSKRKAERALASKEALAAESRAAKPSAPSPVAVRRPSTAAACTIYPTPPDGNPLSAVPPADTDPAPFNANHVGDAFDVGPDTNEPKRQRSESNLLGEADHMFSDMGGDMFGDHDITEADFNFFDEQPGDLDLDVPMADVIAANRSSDAAVKTEQDAADAANRTKVAALPERNMVVFAKPELKHARSSRNEASGSRGRDTPSGSVKREPSPFDPHTVFKRVRASLAITGHGPGVKPCDSTRATRIFDTMNFDPSLPMINKKYEQGGQFDYRKISSLEKPRLEQGILPETDYLKRHGKQGKRSRDRHFNAESLMRGLTGLEPPASHPSPTRNEGSLSDDYDSSVGSDQDDSSYTTEEPASPLKSSVKLLTLDDDAASPVPSLRDSEPTEEPDQQLAMELPRLAKPESPELPLSLLFLDPEPLSLELSLGDEDLIQVAQILTDQAATGSLDILNGQEGTKVLPSTNLWQPTRLPPRPIPVRRSETKLSVLPSAVLFWESLGLAPSSGGKNVNAVCVFPGWNGMADNAKTFMGCLKSVYETLKLGSFESITLPGELEDGLLRMGTVLGAISKLQATAANIVIYFVYPPHNPGIIVEACVAFQGVFDSYRKSPAAWREAVPNELVLQLISTSLLSSPTAVVVTPAPELIKICMETYDRCTLFGGPMPAPAIKLEQPLPRIIDFKLTMSPSASLIRENSCIHVAYAQSVDERWITAAWTDDRGNQQETASYCLSRKGRPQSRSTSEVAHEIWESTLDLISVWKVHWRVVITKCGPMNQQEIDFWADLARTEIKASVTMILMTVDTNPSLQLIPPLVKLPQPPALFYTTPVSTPQANIVSPEQSGTPATPARDANAAAATPGADGGGESEYEAVLSDVTDQTWGAVVGHRLNNSSSVVDVHPALASGYLIKRTGIRVEDAPALMEVNLAHTDATPRAYEPLLREMLSYFRGLGTLARARGVVQRETDVRPWHIAAAEKGARALYLLM
ncbi:mediator of RNA polymerase II transcription subunit 13 [Hirsutella rhossiliensis]|uniref:Mediator of RNA polymerase II transcription subunit 13 n=1 Tax=Hirsutella rhossiliensis TaxID=111463 RepID=A0A9P8MWG3_9HYPO|nr:mediator of RNA polymerase II transcription subunit 13 [Hirsutella rhossiliensis]KAH0961649.1 mediator of RNA polymerase II transcription subunit 13 [Hirsutella rhossiliensis]